MSSNPFPGLRHFEATETHLFFGRDGHSNELLRRLQESRFLALVGVSGSGKSSLVRAGLLPALYGGLMASVESDWRIAIFRPGNNPIGNMAQALIAQAGFGEGEVEVAIAETTLRRGNLGLLELVRQARQKVREDGTPFLSDNENILLVVDQFEEIFRIIEQYDELVRVKQLSAGTTDPTTVTSPNAVESHPREEASAFVKLLLESTEKDEQGQYKENIYVIVTMRSDYLGETAQFWGMPERINEGQYLIPRLTRDERRKAIVGPVAVAGGKIAEPLVNQLLNDAGENPGHLPILQHALMRMWELAERSPRNGGLSLKHYTQIGTLSGALSQHANEAYDELPEDLQKLAAKIFKCLTEKSLANRETRRPMTLAGISKVVNASESDVMRVVEVFRKQGRWFLMPPPSVKLEPDTLIDIAHESLISGWDKLSKWVNDEAESARTYKRLADTAILKERKQEDFYRGPALQLALKWRQDNAPNPAWARRYHPEYEKAIAFLDASAVDAAKAVRRRRITNVILAVLVMLTLTSAGFGLVAQQRALDQQKKQTAYELEQRGLAQQRETEAKDLKKKAEDAQKKAEGAQKEAEDANAKLTKSLTNEKTATQKAKDAEALALAQADKARRLQITNQEQATLNGYFRTAFGDVAARDYDVAVKNLDKARSYFHGKKEKANEISTQINIADIYRIAANTADDFTKSRYQASAVDEYDKVLKDIGANDNLRATTLLKAGSVWEKSKDPEEARQSAGYHEDAAAIYTKPDKNEAANAYLAAGTTLSRLKDEESFQRANGDFDKALSVLGNDHKQIAEMSEKIGGVYATLSTTESDDEEDETPAVQSADAEDRVKDRARRFGGIFYQKAARAYEELKASEKTAELKQKALDNSASMQRKAGNLMSGGKSPNLLVNAATAFSKSAELYAQAGNPTEQRSVLLEAGNKFLENGDRTLADQFYGEVISLAGADNVEKANSLKEIGSAYGESSDLKDKQKAVAYYKDASALYKALTQKDDEVEALLDAGNILNDLDDDVSIAQTKQLYEDAINVYQNDLAKQASIVNRIADGYSRFDEIPQKQKAVEYYRRSASLAHQAGDKRQEVSSLVNAGGTLLETKAAGADNEASRIFEEAVSIDQNDVFRQSATLSRIATVYAGLEPPQRERAFQYYDRAILTARQHSDKAAEVNAILAKARGVGRLDHQDAQVDQLYDQAAAVYNNDPAKQVETIVRVGKVVMSGAGITTATRDPERVKKAEQYFERAITLAGTLSDKKILAAAHLDIGTSYRLPAGRDEALSHYQSALAIYNSEGDEYGQAMALYRLVVVRRSPTNAQLALRLFQQVLPAVKASGKQKELADAYYALGYLYRNQQDYKSALENYTQALAIFETLPDQDSRVTVTKSAIRGVQRVLDRSLR